MFSAHIRVETESGHPGQPGHVLPLKYLEGLTVQLEYFDRSVLEKRLYSPHLKNVYI